MKEKKRKIMDLFNDAVPLPDPDPAAPTPLPALCPGITIQGEGNTVVLLLPHHPTAAPLPLICSRTLPRD